MLLNPWLWLGALLLLTAAAGTGFVSGMEWEQGQEAQRKIVSVDRVIEHTKTVIKRDNKALKASQETNAKLRAENERLLEEARRNAQAIPDPAACHLRLERVLNIRRAWGIVDAGAAEPQGAVREPAGRPVPEER